VKDSNFSSQIKKNQKETIMAIPTEQSFLTASENDDDCTRTKNEKKVDRSSSSLSYIIGTIVVGLVTLSFLYAGGTTTTTTTTPYSSYHK